MKKLLSVILCLTLIFGFSAVAFAAGTGETTLRFDKNGKFKILVLADCQDTNNPDSRMMEVIGGVMDIEKPDLVVLTGDNVVVSTSSKFREGATKLLQPIVDRNVPYAYTYGNHDDESGVSKETQYNIYKSIGTCLTYDQAPEISGFGTCNLPVYSSDGTSMKFNLWMIDSMQYEYSTGSKKYDKVHDDQLDWIEATNNRIKSEQGREINSLMFQHIIVPEINSCFVDSKWSKGFKEGKGSGTVLENPCPPSIPSNQYSVACRMGGVLGIVTGHDHTNNFIAKPGSVDLIQVSGMTYHSYGNESVRGCHIITLDENDTTKYEKKSYFSNIYLAGGYSEPDPESLIPKYYSLSEGGTYIGEISFSANDSKDTALNDLRSKGFTVLEKDLNGGAGGYFIYLGYKTTTNINNAIRGIAFSNDMRSVNLSSTRYLNGVAYIPVDGTDLNGGAGGAYIFGYYTMDPSAGTPITDIIVNESFSLKDARTCVNFGGFAQELNEGTTKHTTSLFCHVKTNLPVLDVDEFMTAYEEATSVNTEGYTQASVNVLQNAVNSSSAIYNSLSETRMANVTQTELDALKQSLVNGKSGLHAHTPGEPAGCTVGQYCVTCGELLVGATGHSLETHAAKAPTCTEIGWSAYETCNNCGYTTYAEISANGHDTVTHAAQAPTCTEIGWSAYETCNNCDYTTYAEISANGHDTVTHAAQAPTCIEDGWKEYVTCNNCDYTTYSEIPATGHDTVTHAAKAPTCTEIGWSAYETCNNCDYTTYAEIPATGHDTVTHAAKAPTCTEIGWSAYETCNNCDYTTYAEISANGHDTVTHAAKAPTCTEIGWNAYETCKNCDYNTYTGIPSNGHDKVYHEAQESTYDEAGWNAYETCRNCSYTTYTEIPAKRHILVEHAGKAATCTEYGWKAYVTCDECDYTTYSEIPARGHDKVYFEAKAPTCIAIGWNAYEACKNCDYTTCEVINATGHDIVNYSAKSPTCTEIGWNAYEACTKCSYTTYEVINANGHDTVTHAAKAPTCTEDGWKEYVTCNNCNYTTYSTLYAKGHDKVSHEGQLPTCTTGGWTEYVTCKNCDYTTYSEIPATGHDIVNYSAKSPTCTEIGWNAYETCNNCGYTTYAEISASGHDKVFHEGKEPTCTAVGWNAYETCNNCSFTTYTQLPKTEHSLEKHSAKAPTCTTGGWKEYVTCRNCDYTTYTEVPATGHSLEKHSAKAPTCTTGGWKEYVTCRNCDYTTYSEAPATGHSLEKHSAKAPTCTTGGWKEYVTCKNCDYTTYSEAPATGHSDANGDKACDACGESTAKPCTHLCHKSGFAGFIWKIVNFFNKLFRVNKACSCGTSHW